MPLGSSILPCSGPRERRCGWLDPPPSFPHPVDSIVKVKSRHLLGEPEDEAEVEGYVGLAVVFRVKQTLYAVDS